MTGTKLDLSGPALRAPAGNWSDVGCYPDVVEKTAVLPVRLAKDHPLLDGNRRAIWVTLHLVIANNGWAWHRYPSTTDLNVP